MRNKYIAVSLATIVASVAIYTGVWFLAANCTKKVFSILEANLSKKHDFKISYSNISLSGYPFKINLNFSSPKIQTSFATTKDKDVQKNSYQYSSKNDLVLSSNLIGSNFSLIIPGNNNDQIKIGDNSYNILETSPNSKIVSLHFNDSLVKIALLNADVLKKDNKEILKYIHSIKILAKDLDFSEAKSGQLLRRIKNLNLYLARDYLTSDKSPLKTSSIKLDFDNNYQALSTPELDNIAKPLLDFKERPGIKEFIYNNLFSPSINGEVTNSAKGRVVLALNEKGDFNNIPLNIEFDNFHYKSDLFEENLSGILILTDINKKDAPESKLRLAFTLKANEKAYNYAIDTLKQAALSENSEKTLTPKKYADNAYMLFPEVHKMGTIAVNADIIVQSELNNIAINQLDFSNDNYAVKITGNYKKEDVKGILSGLSGEGKLNSNLINYKSLVADINSMAIKYAKYNAAVNDINDIDVNFMEPFQGDLSTLLESFAETKDKDNLTIVIKNDSGQFLPTIGKLPFFQAIAKVQDTISPYLKSYYALLKENGTLKEKAATNDTNIKLKKEE